MPLVRQRAPLAGPGDEYIHSSCDWRSEGLTSEALVGLLVGHGNRARLGSIAIHLIWYGVGTMQEIQIILKLCSANKVT